tara:strand:- start:1029 stop:1442 length:414 start_codon:yes stop_codon:yes gene_type:complete
MTTTFSHKMTVKMYDTDCAGILYFGNQFRFFEDALESMMDFEGASFKELIATTPYIFVVVHTEADYYKPLYMGDKITVEVSVGKIGTTSFQMNYKIFKGEQLTGSGNTVHACLNRKTQRTEPLPTSAMSILTKYLES